MLGVRQLKTETLLTASTLFDMVKLSFGVVAGAGALVALVVAYRKQRVDEESAQREATRLHTERFTTAVTQLGDPSPAVRLGGVHALAALADDAPALELRQTCIDVLCAYLRMPYVPDPGPEDQAAHHEYLSLREVRLTIIRLIRDHLQPESVNPHSWRGRDFDFTGATFDGGDFSKSVFSGERTSFDRVRFASGKVSFDSVQFKGWKTSFSGAYFDGGIVSFAYARFDKMANFVGAHFNGATVRFGDTEFAHSSAYFTGARFTAGLVSFVSRVSSLREVQFLGGGLMFERIKLEGAVVEFDRALFKNATVSFDEAQFSDGSLSFKATQFHGGSASFKRAIFNGCDVSFVGTWFPTAVFSFQEAQGAAPTGLLPPRGASAPANLLLPAHWLSTSE
jgi:uncharacterized protein YjbI with pentapeptide repeats